jgi:hypothetical protein
MHYPSCIGFLTAMTFLFRAPTQCQRNASEDDWSLPSWVAKTPNSGFYGGHNGPAEFTDIHDVKMA